MSETSRTRVSPDEVAEICARSMWEEDKATRALGMRLEETRPGYARLSMPVREDMVNGHDTCHGGFIFTLADSAFAFACNYNNYATVAAGASIEFIAPPKLGDILVAVGEERTRSGRMGVYDVRVEKQDGTLIALFRGKSYQTKNQMVPGLDAGA